MDRYDWFKLLEPHMSNDSDRKFGDELVVVDDWTFPWLSFVFVYPMDDKTKAIFDKQVGVSNKVGVLSKWLIKVAKQKGVSQNLIDYYFTCKERAYEESWLKKSFGHQLETMEKYKNQDPEHQSFRKEFDMLMRLENTEARLEERKARYRLTFQEITTILIKEVIERY